MAASPDSLRPARGAIAACLTIAALGRWLFSSKQAPVAQIGGQVASSAGGTGLTIESSHDGARVSPGAVIQTSGGEVKSLIVRGKHQVVMNASTRLSIEPLADKGGTACLVSLARGEIYVQVEHDGRPFLVQTPYGRAVITGTTFDVQATEAGTTLVVVEGSVRFDSDEGAVQVLAGQQSRIAVASAPPSVPTACDAVALTVWAGAGENLGPMAQDFRPEDFLPDGLLPLPSPGTRTELKSISCEAWVRQNREWFRRQFPDLFRLQEALGREGVEVDYPDLLLNVGCSLPICLSAGRPGPALGSGRGGAAPSGESLWQRPALAGGQGPASCRNDGHRRAERDEGGLCPVAKRA